MNEQSQYFYRIIILSITFLSQCGPASILMDWLVFFSTEQVVNGNSYLSMLLEKFWLTKELLHAFFQQGRASASWLSCIYARQIWKWLHQHFVERLISRSRALDNRLTGSVNKLDPCDFCLWGCAKNGEWISKRYSKELNSDIHEYPQTCTDQCVKNAY